jgi:hypothetical protein
MSHKCLYDIINTVSSGFSIPAIGSSEGRGFFAFFFQNKERRLKNAKATGSTMKLDFILACCGYRIFIKLGDLRNGNDKLIPALNQLSTMP